MYTFFPSDKEDLPHPDSSTYLVMQQKFIHLNNTDNSRGDWAVKVQIEYGAQKLLLIQSSITSPPSPLTPLPSLSIRPIIHPTYPITHLFLTQSPTIPGLPPCPPIQSPTIPLRHPAYHHPITYLPPTIPLPNHPITHHSPHHHHSNTQPPSPYPITHNPQPPPAPGLLQGNL